MIVGSSLWPITYLSIKKEAKEWARAEYNFRRSMANSIKMVEVS